MRALLVLVCLLAALPAARAVDLQVALGVLGEQPARPGDAVRGTGQPGGLPAFNEDLARELCRRVHARCAMVHVPFADILPGVEHRKFHLGFGNFLRTPEREQRVAFSDALWRSSSRLVATPEAARRHAARLGQEVSLAGLRDARVAAVAGTQQEAYLRAIAGEQGLSVVSARTMAEMFALLRDDQADFCLLPMLSAYAVLNREAPGSFEFVGPPLADAGLGGSVHIALPKGDPELRQRINQALAGMRADGTYHRIGRQHFPLSLD